MRTRRNCPLGFRRAVTGCKPHSAVALPLVARRLRNASPAAGYRQQPQLGAPEPSVSVRSPQHPMLQPSVRKFTGGPLRSSDPPKLPVGVHRIFGRSLRPSKWMSWKGHPSLLN